MYLRAGNSHPMHINGIVITAGNPKILDDIEMKHGDTLIEIGTPTILPDPAVNVLDLIAKMEKDIDELKKENADLKKQVEELKKK